MRIEKIKVIFVNIETGMNIEIGEIIPDEPFEKGTERFDQYIRSVRQHFLTYDHFMLPTSKMMIISKDITEITKKGLFKFEYIFEKFLTEDDL